MLILKIILKNKKNILKTITTAVKKNNFSYWIIAVKCLQAFELDKNWRRDRSRNLQCTCTYRSYVCGPRNVNEQFKFESFLLFGIEF
jgi:hypothetical protein